MLTPLLLLITCLQAEDDEERLEWKQAICESIPGMAAHAAGKLERSPVLKSAELQGWLKKRQVHGNTTRWQRRWCAFHQVRRARSTSPGAHCPSL